MLRDMLILAAIVHLMVGQVWMVVWHFQNHLRPVRLASWDDAVQEVGGYFLSALARALCWPVFLHRWLARSTE